MTEMPEYGPARSEESAAIVEILSWSFGGSTADTQGWVERFPAADLRVSRREGKVVGALGILWMGQFFGGRSVPTAGISAVGIAPEARGKRTASRFMREVVREVRDRGCALSTLYPATQPLYRSVGYELAGARYLVRISPKAIDLRDREMEIRPFAEADREAMREAYREHARTSPGHLDRSEYIWSRVEKPRGDAARGFLAVRGGRIEGYTWVMEKKKETGPYDLQLADLVALTPAAGRRLLSFYADHRSLAEEMTFYAPPSSPFLHLLAEQAYSVSVHYLWMVRIAHLERALAERGYPEGLEADLHLAVTDEVLPENAGSFVLSIAGGRGEVRRGGRGTFRLDARGLASLYTGFLPPAALAAAGRLEASPEEIRKAESIFGGPTPTMPDMF